MGDRWEELRAALAGASPGPWRAGGPTFRCVLDHGPGGRHGAGVCRYTFDGWADDYGEVSRDIGYTPESVSTDRPPVVAGTWDYEEGGVKEPADAAFIAAARNALPHLLAERDALLAACKALLCLSLPNDVSGRKMLDDAVAAVKNAEGV
jgi:hypothetical protein